MLVVARGLLRSCSSVAAVKAAGHVFGPGIRFRADV
jgi:hypothetical protein